MSLASRMIGTHAAPWFTVNTEPVDVSYVDANNVSPISFSAIVSAPQTVIRFSDDGHRSKVRIRDITFYASAGLDAGGLDTPELDGVFTIDSEKWVIDSESENGVRSTTGNFHKISLKATKPMSRGYAGMIDRG